MQIRNFNSGNINRKIVDMTIPTLWEIDGTMPFWVGRIERLIGKPAQQPREAALPMHRMCRDGMVSRSIF